MIYYTMGHGEWQWGRLHLCGVFLIAPKVMNSETAPAKVAGDGAENVCMPFPWGSFSFVCTSIMPGHLEILLRFGSGVGRCMHDIITLGLLSLKIYLNQRGLRPLRPRERGSERRRERHGPSLIR